MLLLLLLSYRHHVSTYYQAYSYANKRRDNFLLRLGHPELVIYVGFDVFFVCVLLAGKGSKVSFVLNQDFHSGYANENSTAYSILANNVKGEVSLTVVAKY